MDFKSILSYLGTTMEILGVLAIIPILVSLAAGDSVYIPFFATAIISFVLGTVLDKRFEKKELSLSSAMVLSATVFVVISLVGGVPYFFYMNPADAVFESVSGFTTTGLTTLNPESIPMSINFWRAFTQWIGGLGILFIFMLLVGSPGMSAYYMYRAEGRSERIEANTYHTIKKVAKIYGVYTVVGIVLLSLVGMPILDSFITTFSSLSTGSFSAKNNSIAGYNNPAVTVIVIVLMVLGATSFFVHSELWKRKFLSYVKNPETRIFWVFVLIFSVLMSFAFLDSKSPVANGIFHTFSALTTTGFTLAPISGDLTKFLIVILMLIGGYAGSTAGGLKLVRIGMLRKSIGWINRKVSSPPSAVIPFKYDKRVMHESDITIVSLFILIFILILGISALVLSFMGYSTIDAFFQTTAAQTNSGMATIPIADMPVLGKIILMINMLVGRLEILPFFVLIYTLFRVGFRR